MANVQITPFVGAQLSRSIRNALESWLREARPNPHAHLVPPDRMPLARRAHVRLVNRLRAARAIRRAK
jgi:hypothetical protein